MIGKSVLTLLLLNSCARVGYLLDQGYGQLKLVLGGQPNREILRNPGIPRKHKQKIRDIEKYKDYFYRYWNRKPGPVYSKTVFLEQEAVSHLVTASPFNRVQAVEECFPFVGCFPYLGFFNQKKARKHALKLQKKGLETHIRPVYAYSSLGYFNDRILSSFFHYNDFDLAELVFHELFHAMFFVKGEVDLNENLATYFSREMAFLYFRFDPGELSRQKDLRSKNRRVSRKITGLAQLLDRLYQQQPLLTPAGAREIKENFFKNVFNPKIKSLCQKLSLSPCRPLRKKWNNASLAAFLTYSSQENKIARIRKQRTLKEFFEHVKKSHASYQKGPKKTSFSEYLLRRTTP